MKMSKFYFSSSSCGQHSGFKLIARVSLLTSILFATAGLNSLYAQLTGIKNIPGDYATVTAAVTDLNTQGVGAGGVTINVAAGYTEVLTAPLVLTIATNAPSATKPVTFKRAAGMGANPLLTAPVGTTTTLDGMFILNGVDYVTIDGIDLQENAANTTTTQQMEWGYALVKTGVTNGSQNNTIKNCTVTLNKANTASVGIYIGNHLSTSLTALVLTSFAGTSSYNKFYNNTVQNCFHGIDLNGYTTAVAPYDFYDQGNEIGGIAPGRNRILNFGGGATGTVNGITCNAQNNLKIFKTFIDNSGGAATSTTLNGILTTLATNANIDIYNDTISLSSSATTSNLVGINNGAGTTGAGNTINIYNCEVKNCTYTTATSAEFRGIAQTATATYTNIYNNSVINNTVSGTGQFSPIYYSGSSTNLCLKVEIYNNTISGNSKTGTSGQFNCIFANASAYAINCYGNLMFNNSATASSSPFYAYYNFAFGYNENVYNNQFYNNTAGTGGIIAFFVQTGSGPTDKQVYGNVIHDLTSAGQTGAIQVDYSTQVVIRNNNIYNLSSTATTGTAGTPNTFGINVGSTSSVNNVVNVYNNFISDLKAPAVSNTTAVYGIWAVGSTVSNLGIHHNTVYLNAASSAISFGTACLALGSAALSTDVRNNILVNNSVPGSTSGNTVAIQRSVAALTNYAVTSGNNCLYAGTPAANRLIYTDGTNSDQTLQAFKNRVGPREQASFSELPPFVNIASAPYDLHLQTTVATQCEKGAKPIALVSVDYDGTARNATTPDVGADEIAGLTTDIASPDIQYTLLTNSGVATTRVIPTFATITDPSGINVAAGTKPRLYY